MSTNQEIINRALLDLQVLESGQSPTADESSDMLIMLNQMMAAWALSDRDLNFPPQDTLSDTCPIPMWAEKGVVAGLAIDAASSFQAPVSPSLLQKYTDGMLVITRTLINQKLDNTDMSHLPSGYSSYRWNIDIDS